MRICLNSSSLLSPSVAIDPAAAVEEAAEDLSDGLADSVTLGFMVFFGPVFIQSLKLVQAYASGMPIGGSSVRIRTAVKRQRAVHTAQGFPPASRKTFPPFFPLATPVLAAGELGSPELMESAWTMGGRARRYAEVIVAVRADETASVRTRDGALEWTGRRERSENKLRRALGDMAGTVSDAIGWT